MQAHSHMGTGGRGGGSGIKGDFLQEGPEQRHPVQLHFPPGQEHEQPPLSAII